MKDSTLKLIFENSLGVAINMNDTFYYACADSASIDTDELEDLEPVIELYGIDAFIAFEAIRRGHDPQIPQHITANFLAAKTMIQDIMDKADEYGAFFTLRDTIKMKAHTPQERKRLSKAVAKAKDWFSFFTHR